ncbi:hypothetical protein [Streptomyces sp. NPDC059491]|uniref:hypothetical protein n=1 Tax=Streptomyces sp. NPDC059491 TaxID=3346850 RepID=UPI0036B87FFE
MPRRRSHVARHREDEPDRPVNPAGESADDVANRIRGEVGRAARRLRRGAARFGRAPHPEPEDE